MFFILFQSFPAAFILYWLGTNVAYFGIQYWLMKTVPVPQRPTGGAGGQQAQSGSAEEKRLSYEEKKAMAQGKKVRKDEETSERKRRR